MKTKIFEYKGYVGIESHPNADGVIACPKKSNQNLGYVVKAKSVKISPSALIVLKTIKKSHDAIGDIDIFSSNEGVIVSWIGGNKKLINPNIHEGSSSYDASLIVNTDKSILPPQDFIDYIDSL